MRRILASAAVVAAALTAGIAFAPSAHAAGQACVHLQANGQDIVNQCVALP